MEPAEVTVLPVDELALRVLADVAAQEAAGVELHQGNWMLAAEQAYGRTGAGAAAVRALAEGWQWLSNHGLVAQRPGRDHGWLFVTRLGIATLERGLVVVQAAARIGVDLHPLLERQVRRQFLMGEYELAAFAAMKQVEVEVRRRAGASDSLLGTKLMQEAFKTGGPLADGTLDPGEAVARMDLFKGAIGTFKNPSSHRPVDYDDPTLAAEVVLLADLLLRLLDR